MTMPDFIDIPTLIITLEMPWYGQRNPDDEPQAFWVKDPVAAYELMRRLTEKDPSYIRLNPPEAPIRGHSEQETHVDDLTVAATSYLPYPQPLPMTMSGFLDSYPHVISEALTSFCTGIRLTSRENFTAKGAVHCQPRQYRIFPEGILPVRCMAPLEYQVECFDRLLNLLHLSPKELVPVPCSADSRSLVGSSVHLWRKAIDSFKEQESLSDSLIDSKTQSHTMLAPAKRRAL